jgi:hypothetical protein
VLLTRVKSLEVTLRPPDHYGRRELAADFESRWVGPTVGPVMLPGVADGLDEERAAGSPVVSWLVAVWDEHERRTLAGLTTPESRAAACRTAPALLLITSRLRPADRAGALADGWPYAMAVGAAHLHLRIAPDITPDALAAVVEAVSRPRPDDVPSIAWGCVCRRCGCPRCDMSAGCPYCSPDRPTPALWGCRWSEFSGCDWFALAADELDSVAGPPASELEDLDP